MCIMLVHPENQNMHYTLSCICAKQGVSQYCMLQALMSCSLSAQSHQQNSTTSAPTPELGDVFQKLSDLESGYRCLKRPVGLPDSIEHWSDSADDSSFESISPTVGVRSTIQSVINGPAVWNESISKG